MLRFWRAKQTDSTILTFALAKGVVSLAIAEDHVGSPTLKVSDHAEVLDGDWVAAIKELADKYPSFMKGNPAVMLVLGPSLYQSVQLDRPQLPDAEISQALKFNLRDLVSLPPNNIASDYYDVPTQLAGQDKINAIVADKALLESLVTALRDISTNLRGIVAEEQAVASLFEDLHEPAVVAYQHDFEPALIQVYKDGELQVNRFVSALEKLSELGHDELNLGAGAPLSVEVQRSADYFERQLRQRPVREVVAAIGTKQRAALQQQLESDLGLTVRWAEYPAWAQELAAGNFSDFPALGGVLLAQQLQGTTAGDAS